MIQVFTTVSNHVRGLFLRLVFFVKLMTEVLFGIRVLKFYNWEQHITEKINQSRKKELNHLKALKYLDALCVYTWAALPVVISMLTFITYVLLGNSLTAVKVSKIKRTRTQLSKLLFNPSTFCFSYDPDFTPECVLMLIF